ncbi:ankyrin repeat-containing domain protein [Gorgonomyces haynaldii]|nr:ankyrin repeat-containing domain protein [Gorgonomyces haynaldii]
MMEPLNMTVNTSVEHGSPQAKESPRQVPKGRPRAQSSVMPKNAKLDLSPQGDTASLSEESSPKVSPVSLSPSKESPRSRRLSDGPSSSISKSPSFSSQHSSFLLKVSPLTDAHTFAYFRRNDTMPKKQRQMLLAMHMRQKEIIASGVTEDMVPQAGNNPNSRGSSMLGKLNSLLKNKKKQKTRGGILHEVDLAVHDRRIAHAISLINDLTSNSIRKKRVHESNRIFLKAMANRLDAVCLMFLDKGFPENINAPINGPSAKESDKPVLPTYFMLSITFGLEAVFKAMLKMKPQVNYSWYQITPLMLACWSGNLTIANMLLEIGANANRKLLLKDFLLLKHFKQTCKRVKEDQSPEQPQIAITTESFSGVSAAIQRFMAKHKQYGTTGLVKFSEEYIEGKYLLPFEQACLAGHEHVAKAVILKTEANLIASSYFSLLLQQSLELSCLLVNLGASLYQRDSYGCIPIHLAARQGNLDLVVLYVISEPMVVHATGCNAWTALHEAASFANEDIVKYLIFRGADVNVLNDNRETPMQVAKRIGYSQIVIDSLFGTAPDEQVFKKKEEQVRATIKMVSQPEQKDSLDVDPQPKKRQSSTSKFSGFFSRKSIIEEPQKEGKVSPTPSKKLFSRKTTSKDKEVRDLKDVKNE